MTEQTTKTEDFSLLPHEVEALAELRKLGRAAVNESCSAQPFERDATDAFRAAIEDCNDDMLWRMFERVVP